MRIAVISDIHSNLFALNSVLSDIRMQDVDFIVNTGDNVGYSPFPNEVIDLVRQNNIISIQGNYDKAIGNRELVCGCDYKEPKLMELAGESMAFTNSEISDTNRLYLRCLPKGLKIQCEELKLQFVHGSPRRINEPLREDSTELEKVLEEMTEDVLIYGHTHIPGCRIINGKYAINAGSVGKPIGGGSYVTYAILEIINRNVKADIIKVKYDNEEAAKAIEATIGLPGEFASMLR